MATTPLSVGVLEAPVALPGYPLCHVLRISGEAREAIECEISRGEFDGYRPEPSDQPLIDKSTRTIQRWVETYREELAEVTGDERWHFLTTHDLRRT